MRAQRSLRCTRSVTVAASSLRIRRGGLAQRRRAGARANAMESLLWSVRTLPAFGMTAPILKVLLVLLILCWDYPILLVYRLFQRAFARDRTLRDADAVALPLLVVIPSLLRNREELDSMMSTVQSIADNG